MPYFCSLDPEVVAISIPILMVCGGVLIAITAIVVKGRKEEQEHRERLTAMEKGLPLPTPAPEIERPKYSSRRANGLVLTGIGLAVTIGISVESGSDGVWGLIPLFMGIGLLIASTLDKREYDAKKRAEQDRTTMS